MLTRDNLDFLLKVAQFLHDHWESPDWGRQPLNQSLILLATQSLAQGIDDPATRSQILKLLDRALNSDDPRSVRRFPRIRGRVAKAP